MDKALVLDTETTGLISNHSISLDKQPEIIEFYAAFGNLKTKRITREYHSLVKPSKYPMSQKIIEETKTQLSNDMLVQAPSFAKIAPMLRKLVETAPVVIAHNAAFDTEMIGIEFERLGEKIVWPAVVCTVEQTVHIKGYRLSLTNLHIELFGKKFDEAHRAKPDTQALWRCCCALYAKGML